MKKVILVVDDDRLNLMVAQKLLSEEYRVAAVNSGELALHYLERNIPDLVLLDIQMPKMDGLEVMRRLQEDKQWRKISVIFLTADRTEKTEETCFKMGAVDYIGKPFQPLTTGRSSAAGHQNSQYRYNLLLLLLFLY